MSLLVSYITVMDSILAKLLPSQLRYSWASAVPFLAVPPCLRHHLRHSLCPQVRVQAVATGCHVPTHLSLYWATLNPDIKATPQHRTKREQLYAQAWYCHTQGSPQVGSYMAFGMPHFVTSSAICGSHPWVIRAGVT